MLPSEIEIIKQWIGSSSVNIFGRPFAGKDTVCERLAELIDGVVLGGGDILRSSKIPQHVKEIIDAGGLAPTQDYVNIVLPYLSKKEFVNKPLVLSSVGRWIGEEEGVIQAAEKSGHSLKVAIYLDISDRTAHERLMIARSSNSRERSDDDPEKLERRFDEFNNKTAPVLLEYEKMGLLTTIDGAQSYEEVFQSVAKGLLNLASASR